MSGVEAVIFDWAGTTVDYGSFAPVQAFVEVFRQYDINPTIDEVRAPMGMLKRDHIRTVLEMERISGMWQETYGMAWRESDVDAMYQLFESKLMSILDQFAEPKPYVLETVAALREKGIKIGSTTGYTDEMMEIVTFQAEKAGYAPDCMITPDYTGGVGRPYPYMIFANMEQLKISSVENVIKVGDTISDIREGKNAGVRTFGVLEGSSLLGMDEVEYAHLPTGEKERRMQKAREEYLMAGADVVVTDIRGILEYI